MSRTLPSSVAVLLTASLVAGCALGGPNLQAVADQSDAPSSWQPIDDTVVVEAFCFGSKCSTAVTEWGVDKAPTGTEFESLFEGAGWEDIELNTCEQLSNVTGPVPLCRATANSGDSSIELTASGPLSGDPDPFRIVLRVSAK